LVLFDSHDDDPSPNPVVAGAGIKLGVT